MNEIFSVGAGGGGGGGVVVGAIVVGQEDASVVVVVVVELFAVDSWEAIFFSQQNFFCHYHQ